MIGKPAHYVNGSSSNINLVFSSNVNLTKILDLKNLFMKHVTVTSSTEL